MASHLMTNLLPQNKAKHVAIIMDGNGRWAKSCNKSRNFGHKAGAKSVRKIVTTAARQNLEALTLYAFSSENWQRPKKEINLLFELLLVTLDGQLDELHKNKIKLNILGNYQVMPARLVSKINKAKTLTEGNGGMQLNVALNYGSRWELTQAAKALAQACQKGDISFEDIEESSLDAFLSTASLPPLDLLIRTGGEQRLSNFLLWQAAYAELYFTDTFWPDFDEHAFDQALGWFATRKRRFGKTDAQINQASSR